MMRSLVLAVLLALANTGSMIMALHADGPLELSPEADAEIEPINVEDAGNTTNTTGVEKNKTRTRPARGVMSVGNSYIVQSTNRKTNLFTESLPNKTSNSQWFLPNACDKFDWCLQSFDIARSVSAHTSDSTGAKCGSDPASQDGILRNAWKRVEQLKEGCKDDVTGQQQACATWEDYFLQVKGNGQVWFQWESMSDGSARTLIIPPVKVAEIGKCFDKCNILRHPKVLQIAEPTSIGDNSAQVAKIAEFARAAGCPCCDFELFLPEGKSCKNYELDAHSKTWVVSEKANGDPWDQGPDCTEYQWAVPPIPLAEQNSGDEVLVDPEQTKSSQDIKKTHTAGKTQHAQPGSGVVAAAPTKSTKEKAKETFDDLAAPSESLDQEINAIENPDMVKTVTPDVDKQLNSIEDWSASTQDLPKPVTNTKMATSSLKKELHIIVPLPPPPLPTPVIHDRTPKRQNLPRGSLYTDDPGLKTEPLASSISYNASSGSNALRQLIDIGKLLKGDNERSAKYNKKMAVPET